MGKEWFSLAESVPAGLNSSSEDISKLLKKGEKMKEEGGIGIEEKKDGDNNNNKKKKKAEGGGISFPWMNDPYLASCFVAAAGKKNRTTKKKEKAQAKEFLKKYGPPKEEEPIPYDIWCRTRQLASQPGI